MNDKNTIDPEAVKDAVIARLDGSYTLFYADRNDELSDEQIAVLLRGDNPWESKAFADFEEYMDAARFDAAEQIIKDQCDKGEWEILEDCDEYLAEVRNEVYERDDSDALASVLRQTNARLFRYDLGYVLAPGCDSWEDSEVTDATRHMAEAANLDASDDNILCAMRELIYNSYAGGRFYVVWCGAPAEAVDLASAVEGPGTVTFSRPHLLILNHMNGSGHDVELSGDITLDIKPGSVSLDAAHMGPGYSWTDTACPSLSAYRANVTITRPTP